MSGGIQALPRERCPHLPDPLGPMTWKDLNSYREGERGAAFYLTALRYAQYLWLQGHSARAILAIDRALFAELVGGEPELAAWPMPYAALAWMLEHDEGINFLGNPRISYQHLAGRIKGPQAELRRWRAWACWYLVRLVMPELPPDRRHHVAEPTPEAIAEALARHGLPGEVEEWQSAAAPYGSGMAEDGSAADGLA